MSGDWIHVMLQAARSQTQDWKQHRLGYCTVYDPDSGMGKFLIPELRDDQDNPFETGWCPVGSTIVGDGFGMQYHLAGGATQDSPEQGEQAEIVVYQRTTGLMAVANLTYNKTMPPPGAAPQQATENNTVDDDSDSIITDDDSDSGQDVDGSTQLKPTEFIVKFAPPEGDDDESGGGASFAKFYQDGSGRVNIELTMNLRVKQELNIIVKQGDCNLLVQEGDLNATVSEGDVYIDCPGTTGTINLTAGQDINMNAGRDINMTAARNINRTAG